MKKALVTGATGFVGSNVVRGLLEAGVAVRSLVRPGSALDSLSGLDVEVVEGDLLDPSSMRARLDGCDACLHLAAAYAHPDPAEMYRVNVGGTRAVLEAARDSGVSVLVHASTVGTLGRPGGAPARENDSFLSPGASHYVRSKFQAEILVRSFASEGLPAIVAHIAAPVGPWDRTPTVTGRRILAVMSGSMPSYIRGAINHVAVRDVAAGFVLAAERGRPGTSYLLGRAGGNLSRDALVRLVAEAAGVALPRRAPLREIAGWLRRSLRRRRSGGPASLACDPSWSVGELGLPQTALETAFAEAVAWFRAHGMA